MITNIKEEISWIRNCRPFIPGKLPILPKLTEEQIAKYGHSNEFNIRLSVDDIPNNLIIDLESDDVFDNQPDNNHESVVLDTSKDRVSSDAVGELSKHARTFGNGIMNSVKTGTQKSNDCTSSSIEQAMRLTQPELHNTFQRSVSKSDDQLEITKLMQKAALSLKDGPSKSDSKHFIDLTGDSDKILPKKRSGDVLNERNESTKHLKVNERGKQVNLNATHGNIAEQFDDNEVINNSEGDDDFFSDDDDDELEALLASRGEKPDHKGILVSPGKQDDGSKYINSDDTNLDYPSLHLRHENTFNLANSELQRLVSHLYGFIDSLEALGSLYCNMCRALSSKSENDADVKVINKKIQNAKDNVLNAKINCERSALSEIKFQADSSDAIKDSVHQESLKAISTSLELGATGEDCGAPDSSSLNCETDPEERLTENKLSTQERNELNDFIVSDGYNNSLDADVTYVDAKEENGINAVNSTHIDPTDNVDVDFDVDVGVGDGTFTGGINKSSDVEEIEDPVTELNENDILHSPSVDIEDDSEEDIAVKSDSDYFTQLNEERELETIEIADDDDNESDDDFITIDGVESKNIVESTVIKQENKEECAYQIDHYNESKLKPSTEKMTGNTYPWTNEVFSVLSNVFHLKSFRQNQLEAINATLSGSDVFVLMPTGGGKSLCYQLPALVNSGKTKGTTVVISPLISLMQDQVRHLLDRHIKAAMLNSRTDVKVRRETFNLFKNGFLDLVYFSPEMISASGQCKRAIEKLHRDGRLARVVVDEAHCVSSWGHDFRPDYKALSYFKEQYPDIPVMALTATANDHVCLDIVHNLKLSSPKFLKQSFNRTNLYYGVVPKKKNTVQRIAELINKKYTNYTGIIYCHSKNSCEHTSEKLCAFGIKCDFYHAGMSTEDRSRVQMAWQHDQIKVICATIAFGMGIDKPDVRFVIHLTMPRNLEGYYQETGRAGRDGKHSDCLMYYSMRDAMTLQNLIQRDRELDRDSKEQHLAKLRQVIQYCENTTDCRRQQVLQYFNESFDRKNCHKQCDNCARVGTIKQMKKDVTGLAHNIMSLVKQFQNSRITMIQFQDAIKGSRSAKVLKSGLADSEFYGIGKNLSKVDVERVFFHLVHNYYLEEKSIMNRAGFATNYLRLGRNASKVLVKGEKVIMTFNQTMDDSGNKGHMGSDGKRKIKRTHKSVRPNKARKEAHTSSIDDLESVGVNTTRTAEINHSAAKIVPISKFGYRAANPRQTTIEDPAMKSHVNECYMRLRAQRSRASTRFSHASETSIASDTTLKDMALKLPSTEMEYTVLDDLKKSQMQYFSVFKRVLGNLRKEREKLFGTSTVPAVSLDFDYAGNSSNEVIASSISSQQPRMALTTGNTSKFFHSDDNGTLNQLETLLNSQSTVKEVDQNRTTSNGGNYRARKRKSTRGSRRSSVKRKYSYRNPKKPISTRNRSQQDNTSQKLGSTRTSSSSKVTPRAMKF